MKIFDTYIFKNLSIATLFIAVVLTFIIFLTQSLRFLELVMNAGSASSAFWVLTTLALPRFMEVILPLSLMAATLFLYNKMIIDSELIAMRGMGHSSFALAKPAIALGLIVTILLWTTTMWVTPLSLTKMLKMRGELKAEFSNILFREGVFNQVGKGLTVYIRERTEEGGMSGLMIHDSRDPTKMPSTIMAQRGSILSGENGNQVVVYSGARHEFNTRTGTLQRLNFDRYTIDLPESRSVGSKWKGPDERTITQLLQPDLTSKKDKEHLHEFKVEIHRRITGPLLALAFTLIALSALLLGPIDRRGQTNKIALAIISVIIIQGLFLSAYNLSKNTDFGVALMYILTITPIASCLYFIGGHSEKLRRQILYSAARVSPSKKRATS